VSLLIPTLNRARAELQDEALGVLATDPTRAFAAAAIVLHSSGVMREQWDDDVELSERLFASYPRGLPPPPRPDRAGAQYKLIPDDVVARRVTCTQCAITNGQVFCPTCDGSGNVMAGDLPSTCAGCQGAGMIPCPTCDGTRVCVAAKVRYVTDKWLDIRRAFVPNLGPLRGKVDALIDPADAWPSEHLFEPQPQVVASAYRGASSVREPDFHGFFFGDALGQAVAAIGELVSGATRTSWAVPILWLVWEVQPVIVHVALVPRPGGSLAWVRA